eukprot:CAMPEP_0194208514 /NCGR_PEP_ID=MMETSP0156-20130528/6943_1 /TAXON_ID=33649 /ORGANISM="Thalassionema nitzschioides, Strain L26-B" /LENGTH=40 /DNA_ID= /DNA_START= /DNA_END= /DNA_ORIENTATION=
MTSRVLLTGKKDDDDDDDSSLDAPTTLATGLALDQMGKSA